MTTPHNPGMSEKAWRKLHTFASKMRIKYSEALAAKRKNKKSDISA